MQTKIKVIIMIIFLFLMIGFASYKDYEDKKVDIGIEIDTENLNAILSNERIEPGWIEVCNMDTGDCVRTKKWEVDG
jgi:hypothetical protein